MTQGTTDAPVDARERVPARGGTDPKVWLLATAGALAVLVANVGGIAAGDDGVGYRAIADSLLRGDGLGYFLERPLTVWPPLWPALMAGIAKVTPLDPLGAAVLLNAVTTFVAVLVAHRLLARCVRDPRLVLLGTAVVALGGSTVGFGHLLMTDFAFAVVVMCWLLALMNFRESGRLSWLLGAAALVWLGFGLRYVAVVLVATGGLWLLLDGGRATGADAPHRRFVLRLRDGVAYGAVAVVVPVLWMLRNRAEDGTLLGPRYASARGPVDNAFDILATLGRFLLPGVGNGFTKVWAAVALVALVAALVLALKVLAARAAAGTGGVVAQSWRVLGGQSGLLLLAAGLYLLYMLYIRSTTALNQLDLRLLNPAYLPLLVLGLVLVDRTAEVPPQGESPWWRGSYAAALVWGAANVLAGLVAVALFATGNPYFTGNYESDTFDRVRANAALDRIPADCRVVSNLPNALYPELEARWSPRRTGLESDEGVDDLEELLPTLAARRTCLVWVDEEPRYGHLWSLQQLRDRVDLQQVARDGDVTVYVMAPRT
ncbi:MAG: hypothetical protein ACOYOP_02875 [Microthrixaceae bacterium]